MTNEQKDKVQKELQKIQEAQKELAKVYMDLEKHLRRDH